MPQIQIFFIAMPLSILMGLSLLAFLIGAIMTVFLEALGNHMGLLLGG
jgi:flagellar biosynthetic protein FliR